MTSTGQSLDVSESGPLTLRHALLGAYENCVRVPLLCGFPLASTIIVGGVFVVSDQGQDLLWLLVERSHGKLAFFLSASNATFLLSTLLLSLSVWYSARWLLTRRFPHVPLEEQRTGFSREWLPRALGALVPGSVAFGFCQVKGAVHAVAYAALAVGLATFFIKRRALFQALTVSNPRQRVPLMPRGVALILFWSIATFLLVAGVLAAFPISVAQMIGAPALVPFALVGVTLFGSFVLTYWPLSRGYRNLLPLVVAWCALASPFNDNHALRRAADLHADGAPPAWPRLGVDEHFSQWSGARAERGCSAWTREATGTPVVFVAAAGGGIRAAYWTAAVLEELRTVRGFDCSLFAVSGVSGGSLGAATFVVTNYGRDGWRPEPRPWATTVLSEDFLSPVVGGLLFYDFLQRFLPFAWDRLDRSRTLEVGWEWSLEAGGDSRAFRNSFPQFYRANPWAPALVLNSAVVEDGKRAVYSSLSVHDLPDTHDLLAPELSSASVPLSGAVHNSARFTYVSPAGLVTTTSGERWGRLVDGGYFENSGAATALDLMRALRSTARPILVLIRNDVDEPPICKASSEICSPAPPEPPGSPRAFGHETLSPARVLMAARSARGRLAQIDAVRYVQSVPASARNSVFEFSLQPPKAGDHPKRALADPPLGWSLSDAARRTLCAQARDRVNEAKNRLESALVSAGDPSGYTRRAPASDCSRLLAG